MSTVDRMIHLYGWLLRLYPRRFRDTFGEELQAVFAQAVRDAAACRERGAWVCFLRELLDMPANLLREYFSGERMEGLVDRMLAHPKRSRWQQAGGLAFMLGYGLLELFHGVGQVLSSSDLGFVSWWGFFRIVPDGSTLVPSGKYTDPALVDFAWLLLCGLLIGLLFSLGERGAAGVRRLHYALVGVAALLLPYGILALATRLMNALVPGFQGAAVGAATILYTALALGLIGGVPAALLGRMVVDVRGRKMVHLFFTGVGALLVGLLAAAVTSWALSFPLFVILVNPMALPWRTTVTIGLFQAVVFGLVMGRMYGGMVGRKIGDLVLSTIESS